MADVIGIIKDMVRQKRDEHDIAFQRYNEVLNNPEHTMSELMSAVTEYNKRYGEYNAAMELLIKLYEMGLA